jgi:hypothetical protein
MPPDPPSGRSIRIENSLARHAWSPEFLARIEAWRITQLGPPSKTVAITHLIIFGPEATASHREWRPASLYP